MKVRKVVPVTVAERDAERERIYLERKRDEAIAWLLHHSRAGHCGRHAPGARIRLVKR